MRLKYLFLPAALLLLAPLATAGVSPSRAATQYAGTLSEGTPLPAQPAGVAPAALLPAAMSEDFESSWPNTGWALYDLSNNDGGEYVWGKRNCHPHSGSFAGWSVGGGARGSRLTCLTSDYPDNVNTIAQ